jgi:hypothetical protein
MAARTRERLSDAVFRSTNFCRRFGLGHPHTTEPIPEWKPYADTLDTLTTHDARLAWTMEFFKRCPPETLPPGQRRFGCFSVDPPDAKGVVRIHFYNHDRDGVSPLADSKREARRRELAQAFAWMKASHPEATSVHGNSWLYGRAAYRDLFPAVYTATLGTRVGGTLFQGSSRWGQFLDGKGGVKPALRDRFHANLATLEPARAWEVFPLPTFTARAPIDAFYAGLGR